MLKWGVLNFVNCIWGERPDSNLKLKQFLSYRNEQRGISLQFRCNPENRGLLLTSAVLHTVLDPNANPDAKASLAYEARPCEHSCGMAILIRAGNVGITLWGWHRSFRVLETTGVHEKCNFLTLPKFGIARSSWSDITVQKILILKFSKTFPNSDQSLGTFLEEKRGPECLSHIYFSGVLHSMLQTEAHIY